MVTSALDAASVSFLNDGLHLVDDPGVQIYKPDRRTYQSLLAKLNADRTDGAAYISEDVWLVSG